MWVVTAHINPMLMNEDCGKGSEVSCQNFNAASECGATEHCPWTLWSKATMKSFACEACLNMMSVIGSFMKNGPEELKEMCGYIGFCDTGKEMPLQAMVPAHVATTKVIPEPEQGEKNLVQMKSGHTCELCQYMIKEIIKSLEGNKTKENVINAADKVCSVIPSYVAGGCQDLVNTYGPRINHLLLEETDPLSICSTLNICQHKKSVHAVNVAQLKSDISCALCKMISGYLDQTLEKNCTQTMILHALQKACSILAGTYKNMCAEFVEYYEPILIAALHKEMDPKSLCPKIRVCPHTPFEPLLRTEQCDWGPSYWCKNKETAAQCNADEHCKNHVWN